jgi:hypothetical protein
MICEHAFCLIVFFLSSQVLVWWQDKSIRDRIYEKKHVFCKIVYFPVMSATCLTTGRVDRRQALWTETLICLIVHFPVMSSTCLTTGRVGRRQAPWTETRILSDWIFFLSCQLLIWRRDESTGDRLYGRWQKHGSAGKGHDVQYTGRKFKL